MKEREERNKGEKLTTSKKKKGKSKKEKEKLNEDHIVGEAKLGNKLKNFPLITRTLQIQ